MQEIWKLLMFEKDLVHVLEIYFQHQCICDPKQNAANIKARKNKR